MSKKAYFLIVFQLVLSTFCFAQHEVLLDSLKSMDLVAEDYNFSDTVEHVFTDIYTTQELAVSAMQYKKRRRYFTGPNLTQKAKYLIDAVFSLDYINKEEYNEMLRLLDPDNRLTDDEEYIIDTRSVLQYLLENELKDSQWQKDRVQHYINELKRVGILNNEFNIDSSDNQLLDILESCNNTIVMTLSVLNIDSSFYNLFTPENKKRLRLESLSDSTISNAEGIGVINQNLREEGSENRLLRMLVGQDYSNYDSITMCLMSISGDQFQVLNDLYDAHDYPFFNLNWFQIDVGYSDYLSW